MGRKEKEEESYKRGDGSVEEGRVRLDTKRGKSFPSDVLLTLRERSHKYLCLLNVCSPSCLI